MFGDFLLVHGSSSSPAFKGSGSWGSYVLWINKSLQSDGCSGLNLQAVTSNPFVDEAIPNLALTATFGNVTSLWRTTSLVLYHIWLILFSSLCIEFVTTLREPALLLLFIDREEEYSQKNLSPTRQTLA